MQTNARYCVHLFISMYVGLFLHSAVVLHVFKMFFRVLKNVL